MFFVNAHIICYLVFDLIWFQTIRRNYVEGKAFTIVGVHFAKAFDNLSFFSAWLKHLKVCSGVDSCLFYCLFSKEDKWCTVADWLPSLDWSSIHHRSSLVSYCLLRLLREWIENLPPLVSKYISLLQKALSEGRYVFKHFVALQQACKSLNCEKKNL